METSEIVPKKASKRKTVDGFSLWYNDRVGKAGVRRIILIGTSAERVRSSQLLLSYHRYENKYQDNEH